QGETELSLGPLTIFAGANSSGKSTFIQSILLVAQTLANKVRSRSVVLNGALTSLGQFDDLKSNSGDLEQISIKCTCEPLSDSNKTQGKAVFSPRGSFYYSSRGEYFQEIACEMSFDADPSSSERDLLQIQPRLFTSLLSCVSRDEDNIDQNAEISVSCSSKGLSGIEDFESFDKTRDLLRTGLSYDVKIDPGSLREMQDDYSSAQPMGCILRHFLPDQVIYGIDTVQEDANAITLALQSDGHRSIIHRRHLGNKFRLSKEIVSILQAKLGNTINFDEISSNRQPSLFKDMDTKSISLRDWHTYFNRLPRETKINILQLLQEQDDLFDLIYDVLLRTSSRESGTSAIIQSNPPRQLTLAARYLNNFFASSLKYLGPLRDAPKPLYPLAPAAEPHDVGLRGEHTASILDLHKNKKIKYIPSSHFEKPTVNRKIVTRSLESAVVDWLQYLGVANSVKSKDKGKLGHELKVGLDNTDHVHDLTHVGVGVSQVLPILVMCLLADTDSTLVFEQPELHLHPKVQTLLGDFFLSMALCDKQCIVETHSEYFIDRLRFRIAAATSANELNSKTKIYFVEKPGQSSSFREVIINEYGAISDWPEGFFDQSQQQAEEILNAALKKKRAKNATRPR
ncbi:MAG: DUF3696 domain-containing protein, partial [Spirochaetales bacterium]|nr:DUF3696 domain-containing protein [Spirochaetales bacterium]